MTLRRRVACPCTLVDAVAAGHPPVAGASFWEALHVGAPVPSLTSMRQMLHRQQTADLRGIV
jgi:hypothetical protein